MKYERPKPLSVVVPVHNMAGRMDNLNRWVAQISERDLPIEIILVQDGNDAGTFIELETLSKKYGCMFISVDVKSPGLARNAGIEVASGDYVSFWDADDLPLPENAIEALSSFTSDLDVLISSYEIFYISNKRDVALKESSYSEWLLNPGIWRMIFRKDFIGETRFSAARMGEDQLFLANLHLKSNQLKFLKSPIYRYFIGDFGQLTNSKEALLDISNVLDEFSSIISTNPFVEDYIYTFFVRMTITELTKLKKFSVSLKRFIRLFFEISLKKKLRLAKNMLLVSLKIIFRKDSI